MTNHYTDVCEETIESLRQQLAAALAAIKVKDAALNAAWGEGYCLVGPEGFTEAQQMVIDALAIQPDDSALQAFAEKVQDQCIEIIESYKVSVGNSASGELAAKWTMQNLKEIRDEIRSLKELPK